MSQMAEQVRVYEVGPRDGLQNEAQPITLDAKLQYLELLADAGLREIEATSFVSPKAIPQLADADELMARLVRRAGVRYPVLVPNLRGMQRAMEAGVEAVCVFTAASEPFTQHNIGMSIAESLAAFGEVLAPARQRGMWTRGYVSTAFGCPYQGEVGEAAVVGVARQLLDLGVDEVSIGDTIGVAGPRDVHRVVGALLDAGFEPRQLAMHFHDTRGTALANVAAALELGIRTFDASTGGTGGCPYAPGAAGNLATEDLVYLLEREGLEHGIDLEKLLVAAHFIADTLDRPLATKVGQAGGWDAEEVAAAAER